MMRIANILVIVCFTSALLGCHQTAPHQATAPDLQSFVGKTVAELLDTQHLTLSECRFIDEPPGVLCALIFPTTQLHVALKRQPSLFSEQRQWSPYAVRQAQIVEIRYADH
jgi:hypothetical protein